MAPGDLVQELARRDARGAAVRLVDHDTVVTSEDARVRIARLLLDTWSSDAEVRDVLRPVFAAAVPDQRALIALGDIDIWLRDGRIARGWWTRAAAGPDPELAALGAWRAARAMLRGGHVDDARPFLAQADAAGIREASLALGRIAAQDGDDERAALLFGRSPTDEGRLGLAEVRLRADDVDGAARAIDRLERPTPVPRPLDLRGWEDGVRGEIAFRRGDLEDAEELFEDSRDPRGGRTRHAELRLAQIAVARGKAFSAHFWTSTLIHGADDVAEQARLLVTLHHDLIEEGAAQRDQDD
jgi:hypothetical protein